MFITAVLYYTDVDVNCVYLMYKPVFTASLGKMKISVKVLTSVLVGLLSKGVYHSELY